jgi:acyl carrier protein
MYWRGLTRTGAIELKFAVDWCADFHNAIKLLQDSLTMTGLDRLKNAFVQALGISPTSNFDSLAYGVTQGWDSVAHMNLVAEIESTFDIMFATEDVIDMSSFAKGKEIVAKHGMNLSA